MNAIDFDPKKYSKATLSLILIRAQEWECSPAVAAVRLLNELAKESTAKGDLQPA